ncbi:MAG: putative transport system permease protein [Ilumatobacteraceae bacterium]|nr:putative transport system permease protein [Ilumatobacteraceae bacterium]
MSSAESFIARSQRRKHRVANLVLAVAVGVLAALTISLVAGARRSSSVVDRFFAAAPRYDLRLFSHSTNLQPDVVSALPGVVRADPTPYLPFVERDADPSNGLINSRAMDFSQSNPTIRLLRGHFPDDDLFQVVVNEAVVSQFGVDVGDRLPALTFANDQYDEIRQGVYTPRGPKFDFTIAGVVRTPEDIAFDEARSPRPGATSSANGMIVSLKFWTAHRSDFIDFGSSFEVRLANGAAGVATFLAAAKNVADGAEVLSEPWAESDRKSAFMAPVDLQTGALMSVGIGAAVGTLGLMLLLLRLDQHGVQEENDVLRSMGLTSSGLARVAIARTLPAALAAALLALILSVALSARFPVGLGRQLELHSGVDVDVAVVSIGVVLTAVLPLLVAALFASRSNNERLVERSHPSHRLVANSRLPLHALLGTRMVLGSETRRQRTSAVIGFGASVVATAAAIAVSMWLVGTQRLYDDPASRGWLWDVAIGNVNFPLDPATAQGLQHNPLVGRSTAVNYGQATLNGQSTEVLAFDLTGTAPPDIVRGRLPASPTEAALGAGLMRTLHVGLGGSVTLSVDGSEFTGDKATTTTPVKLTVVGESISPVFGESDVADVALVPLDAISNAGGDGSPRIVLIDVVGSNRAAVVSQLIAEHSEEVHSDVIPSRIVNLRRVRAVPVAGVALAAVVGVVALAATVLAAGRSNRRMLVVLRALGLERSGTRRAVGWQGVVAAAFVLMVGLPIGLLADAAWWRRVSDGLGVRENVPVAWPLLIAAVGIVVVAGVSSAFAAARPTLRSTVAEPLRSE